jgi:hypothetical protein
VRAKKKISQIVFGFSESGLDSRFSQLLVRKCAGIERVFPRGYLQNPVLFSLGQSAKSSTFLGQVKVDFLAFFHGDIKLLAIQRAI